MASGTVSQRPLVAALALVSLLGAADVAAFIATSPSVALKNGGRASGSVGGLAIWLLLLALSGRRLSAEDSRLMVRASLALAALAAVGGVGLAAIHQLAGVGGWRTIGGGALGVAALVLAVAARGSAAD